MSQFWQHKVNYPGQVAHTTWPVVRSCKPRNVRPRHSRGFTLLEILLVIAVMVTIAALATPNLIGMLESHKLRKSGDGLRASFAVARNKAMKSGRIQMFRYQYNEGAFMVKPWLMDDDALEVSALDAGEESQILAAAAPEQLPDGVLFLASETLSDERTEAIYDSIATELSQDQVWSQPILFYPDGSSSSARVVLGNNRNQVVLVTLRGLTGMSEVSGLLRPEEIEP